MIQIPFTPQNFSEECKERLSGVFLNYEHANIESTLAKVARDMASLLGQASYDKLVYWYSHTVSPVPTNNQETAVDYLQRVMLHFAFYDHLIFLQLNIKNDGITTKKNDEETTAFKYQTDELKGKLINTAWFWFNELITLMNANAADFSDWTGSEQKKEIDSLGITYADFNKWFRIDSWYFFINARYVIREVMMDEINPRWTKKDLSKKEIVDAMHRAIAYKVMAITTYRFAYFELPQSIRLDLDSELGGTVKYLEHPHIKKRVCEALNMQAKEYLQKFETLVTAARIQAEKPAAATAVYVPSPRARESDKFYFA